MNFEKALLVSEALAGESIDSFDGLCGELADAILHVASAKGLSHSILYIEPVKPTGVLYHAHTARRAWVYHMIACVEGKAVDPWFEGEVTDLDEYLDLAFPGQRVVVTEFTEHGDTDGEIKIVR
jgi:hypothetical protein